MAGPLEQENNCDDSEQDRNDGFGVKFAQLAEVGDHAGKEDGNEDDAEGIGRDLDDLGLLLDAGDAKEKGDQNQGNQEVKDVTPAQTVDDPTKSRPKGRRPGQGEVGGDLLRLADALGRFFDDLAAEFNFSKLVLLSLVV